MRQKLVAGNWKMHGSLAANAELLGALVKGMQANAGAQCAVLVPYPYLGQIAELLRGTSVAWGAQNLSEHASGAYTGEVSGAMLKDFGCQFVIVGHSERRSLYGESTETVAKKMLAALSVGIIPIVCVGESLAQREAGATEKIVAEQMQAVFDVAGMDALAKSVLAYEPVWAIGTGKTATPEQAQAVHEYLRALVAKHNATVAESLRVLYGGSVKGTNAAALFAMPDVDGGLVGGASLIASDFLEILRAAHAAARK